MKSAFAEVRSLANQPNWNASTRRKLMHLVKQCFQTNPEVYRAQWQPYLQGFPRHWNEPFLAVNGLQEANCVFEMLPFAKLSLSLRVEDLEDLKETPSALLDQAVALNLASHRLTDDQVNGLVELPTLPRLETINLRASGAHEGHLVALLEWVDQKHLKSLELGRNRRLGGSVFRILSRTNVPAHLDYLGLSHCDVTNEECGSLGLQEWSCLTELDLSKNKLDDEGVIRIAHSTCLPVLKTLKIYSNRYQYRGALALVSSDTLPSLETIHHNWYRFSSEEKQEIENIMRSRNLLCV